MQINIGHLNENGVFDGNYSTFALAGRVRAMVRTLFLALPVMVFEDVDGAMELAMLLVSADICVF